MMNPEPHMYVGYPNLLFGEASPEILDFLTGLRSRYLELGTMAGGLEQKDPQTQSKARQLIKGIQSQLQEYVGRTGGEVTIGEFATDPFFRGQVARVLSMVRHGSSSNREFLHATIRGYQLLAAMLWQSLGGGTEELWVPTPVRQPFANQALVQVPAGFGALKKPVVCVLLRAALLPSLVLAREMNPAGHDGPAFALFRIRRHEQGDRLEYHLDLEGSFFEAQTLIGADLLFPDPMNATGGSLLTVLEYLESRGIKPASVHCLNTLAAVEGVENIRRSRRGVGVLSLGLDPALNSRGYIMPGLGDAGDRLNGIDEPGSPRDIMELLASYGEDVLTLYRGEIRKLERLVLHGAGHV